jgi:hypothetical protein
MAFYNSINDQYNFVISFTKNPQFDFSIFAEGYKHAAVLLAEDILKRPHFSDYEAYPVVFLYRQAFELYLKGFYYKANLIIHFKNKQPIDCQFLYRHQLLPLSITFEKICKTLFPAEEDLSLLGEQVRVLAEEFEQIDKDSFAYRYPIDKFGNHSTRKNQIVNLYAFHYSMLGLLDKLDVVNFGLDVTSAQAQEVYEIIQEAQSIINSENEEEG